jgi:hypothetical protein
MAALTKHRIDGAVGFGSKGGMPELLAQVSVTPKSEHAHLGRFNLIFPQKNGQG